MASENEGRVRTVRRWVSFHVDDSSGVLRSIPVNSINGVGLNYPEVELTSFIDAMKGALLDTPECIIEISGPFDDTPLTGSHTVLSGIYGVFAPLSLEVRIGMLAAWTNGSPIFRIAGNASSGFWCNGYSVDMATMTYTARFVIYPGSSSPAWGTEGLENITQPAGFTMTLPFTVQQIGRVFQPDSSWDISSLAPTGKTYYVDLLTGSDAAAGSISAPFKSIYVALSQADVDVVLINGGRYPYDNGWNTVSLARSVSIKSWDGVPVILGSNATGYSWTQHLTYPTVYYRLTGSIRDVWDSKYLDTDGEYQRLALVADVATVAATPGSQFRAGSTYVHLSDDRAPDDNVLPFIDTASNGVIHGAVTVYLENIHFEGGSSALTVFADAGAQPTLLAKNCSFKYSGASNCLTSLGAITIFQNCVASMGWDDGFNYHSNNGYIPMAIEIDCIGRKCGITSDTDNGSTIHDGGKVLRINGEYHHNRGRNVHDVTNATQSWNLGVYAHDSSGSPADCNFAVGTGGSDGAKMWLDCCKSDDSATDIEIDAGATCYTRHLLSDGVFVGTPTAY